jgi:polyisoprenoid-binding protein YceI
LTVRTGRQGVAARAGHDLVIEVTSWDGLLVIGGSGSALSVTADASSLEVREGTGGVRPLTDDDRAEIRRNIAEKVLDSARHAQITFASTAVEHTGADALAVAGDLAIAGVTHPVRFEVALERGAVGTVLRATLPVVQSTFGIRPFSALMGTLKVADPVEVMAEARLPPPAQAEGAG